MPEQNDKGSGRFQTDYIHNIKELIELKYLKIAAKEAS